MLCGNVCQTEESRSSRAFAVVIGATAYTKPVVLCQGDVVHRRGRVVRAVERFDRAESRCDQRRNEGVLFELTRVRKRLEPSSSSDQFNHFRRGCSVMRNVRWTVFLEIHLKRLRDRGDVTSLDQRTCNLRPGERLATGLCGAFEQRSAIDWRSKSRQTGSDFPRPFDSVASLGGQHILQPWGILGQE